MCCERPCVVADVGDSARIIGDFGEVLPLLNPECLTDALLRILVRIDKNAELGRQARARIVGEFSVERMASRTEAILFGLH